MKNRLASVVLLLAANLSPALAADSNPPPAVVASIKPVHSIVAAVMAGAGTPELLLPGGASPHAYALKPSDARKLANARAMFWVGPELETVLQNPTRNLASRARVVALGQAAGVRRLPARHGGVWETDEHDHDHGADAVDGHVWLDPRNGAAMASAIAEGLAAVDPPRATLYRENAEKFRTRMTTLDNQLAAKLRGLENRHYLVFHDAYQYFETRYGLSPMGAVAVAPDRPVGPRRIAELRSRLEGTGVVCAFSTPEFSPRLFTALTEGTRVKTHALDDLGASIPAGPLLYETLMIRMADAVSECLRP